LISISSEITLVYVFLQASFDGAAGDAGAGIDIGLDFDIDIKYRIRTSAGKPISSSTFQGI